MNTHVDGKPTPGAGNHPIRRSSTFSFSIVRLSEMKYRPNYPNALAAPTELTNKIGRPNNALHPTRLRWRVGERVNTTVRGRTLE
jgi:hypothetical protein